MRKNTREIIIFVFIVGLILAVILSFRSVIVSRYLSDPRAKIDTDSQLSVANGQILLSMKGDIYSLSMEGKDLRRLTDSPLYEWWPSYSPDGRRVVFCRQVKKPYDFNGIWMMDSKGQFLKQIVKGEDGILNLYPSFSPDGKKIVFLRWFTKPPMKRLSGQDSSLMEVNVNGSGLRILKFVLSTPKYSSDGQKIYGFLDVRTLQMDRRNLKKYSLDDEKMVGSSDVQIWQLDRKDLTKKLMGILPVNSFEIQYSSDHSKLIFVGLTPEEQKGAGLYDYQIYTASLDGTHLQKITQNFGPKHQPVYFNNDSKIAFIHWQGTEKSVKVMNVDGGNIETLMTR